MKALHTLIAVCLLCSSQVWAAGKEVNTQDPVAMVTQLANNTLEEINQNPELLKSPDQLQALLVTDLLPHINYRYAAFKVIGHAIRETSKEEREAFAETFKDYMMGTFTLLFKQYDPNRHVLKFDPVRIEGQVPARFVSEGKPDISLIFYLRENTKTGEWQVWDLAAEGISQIETKHNEFKPLIRQHGLSYVTEQLQRKLSQGLDDSELSGLPQE